MGFGGPPLGFALSRGAGWYDVEGEAGWLGRMRRRLLCSVGVRGVGVKSSQTGVIIVSARRGS